MPATNSRSPNEDSRKGRQGLQSNLRPSHPQIALLPSRQDLHRADALIQTSKLPLVHEEVGLCAREALVVDRVAEMPASVSSKPN